MSGERDRTRHTRGRSAPTQPSGEPAPRAVDRTGDPDELVGPEEFARIVGWSNGRWGVTSRLTMQRQARLYRAAQPAAAALVGVPARERSRRPELEELPARERTRVLQAVAEYLRDHRPGDTRFLHDLARELGVDPAVTAAALAELARPGYNKPERRELIPDPDEDTPLGPVKHRYRWKRSTAWRFAEGFQHPAPSSGRYTAEQVALARGAVKAAADGGEPVDATSLAKLVGLPADPGKLHLARTLLAQSLSALLVAGEVDLRSREQIAADFRLPKHVVVARLRRVVAEPAITCNRLFYYRGEEIDRIFAG